MCFVSTDHGTSQEVNGHLLAVAKREIGVPTTSKQAYHQPLPAHGYQRVNGYRRKQSKCQSFLAFCLIGSL